MTTVDPATLDRGARPTMQRRVVVLRHLVGLSVAESARELDISEGTVKCHTSRGLAALERSLHSLER